MLYIFEDKKEILDPFGKTDHLTWGVEYDFIVNGNGYRMPAYSQNFLTEAEAKEFAATKTDAVVRERYWTDSAWEYLFGGKR
jgi:hypothetical protein